MTIAYIANPNSVHDAKWINFFSEKYTVLVLSSLEKDPNAPLKESIPVYRIFPGFYPYRNWRQKKNVIRAFKKIIQEQKVDIIHSMYAYPNAIWANEAGFKNHIVTTRGSDMLIDYQNFSKPALRHWLPYSIIKRKMKNALQRATFITSTSTKQQEVLRAFIIESDKLKLIRTGVDYSYFQDKYDSLERTTSTFSILSVRGMTALYNIDLIVDAFQLFLEKSSVKADLFLANYPSDPDYLQQIQLKIKKLHLEEYVQILPQLTQDAMIQQYKNSDLVISIPSSDGTPVSLIECMMLRKPILMNAGNYDSNLFNNETIWQLDSITPSSISNALIDLMNLETSDKLEIARTRALQSANLANSLHEIDTLYQQMACS